MKVKTPFPKLRGERVTLRPTVPEDAERFLPILHEPEVARWWGRYTMEKLREEMAELDVNYAIEIDGAVAGWMQIHEEPEPEYRHVAFDLTLSSDFQGRGFGPEALRLVIGHCIANGHHRFTIDPSTLNDRAIHAFSSVGFKPVGVMRQCERIDGQWMDGLLMDLLADDFVG